MLEGVIEFILNNYQWIQTNISGFIIWTTICCGGTWGISKFFADRKMKNLEDRIVCLQEENEELYRMFKETDIKSRVLMGKNLPKTAHTAKILSKHFKDEDKNFMSS